MVQLRDYQDSAVQAVRDSFRSGHKKTLLVSPTGSGKTVIFSYIAAGMAKNNKRILIVAHRRELLKQISGALKKVGVPHAILAGGTPGIPIANVVVASVFTLVRRMKTMKPFDLIIGVGVGLALGGVGQLLTPVPLTPAGLDSPDDPRKSYSFSSIQNTSRSGTPCPICYGEVIVGSIVVSAGIDISQVAA